ncbi:hypothetical protein [Cryptosporangium arvum]|uniref:hypothetical protein n=1 Tax=Cryptosporangium arvum TaxID=80871 RepID=UPI0004B499C4|nr:hypothetical protein [Cryptosporangium arvum]
MTGIRAGAVPPVGASFRDLEGIGAGAESRLHRAGVVTWAALTEIVGALRGTRERTGDRLQELYEQLSDHGAAGTGAALEHRHEAFVLRLSLTADGRPTHGTITHVRSGRELAVAGWGADAIARFVEAEAGVDPTPARPALPASEPATPGPSEPAAGGPWPPPPSLAACRGSEPDGGAATFDAGRLVGGRRTVEQTLRPVGRSPAPVFRYHADLLDRPYGEPGEWTVRASLSGAHEPPAPLILSFTDVVLPAGVRRARIRLVPVHGPLPQLIAAG